MNRVIAGVLVASLLVVGIGCSSTGRERSQATVGGISDVRDEMTKGVTQIDKTMAALNSLVANPGANLANQYKEYVNQVEALESASERVRSRNQALKAKAQEYFDSWEQDIAGVKSEAVKSVSADRRAAAQASFARMGVEVTKSKTAFTSLMDELRDIQLYLGNDLTPPGVAACKPVADAAGAKATHVKEALGKVVVELARVESELSAGQK